MVNIAPYITHNIIDRFKLDNGYKIETLSSGIMKTARDGEFLMVTGNDGVGDTLIRPGIYCRQKAITSPI